MPDDYEIAVDYMDMTNDRHLWARAADARPGLELSVGRHVVVGDEDADPKVAGSNLAPATNESAGQGLSNRVGPSAARPDF